MKKLVFAIILFAISLNVQAQSSKEKVTELFQLMNLDKMVDGMMDNMISMIKQNVDLKDKNDSTYTEYMEFVGKETKAFTKRMINGDMVTIYTKYFTDEDIQSFIEFYSSPSGKKMIQLMPTVQKELMTKMISKEMPALQSKFEQKLNELKNKKH